MSSCITKRDRLLIFPLSFSFIKRETTFQSSVKYCAWPTITDTVEHEHEDAVKSIFAISSPGSQINANRRSDNGSLFGVMLLPSTRTTLPTATWTVIAE